MSRTINCYINELINKPHKNEAIKRKKYKKKINRKGEAKQKRKNRLGVELRPTHT